MPDLKKRLDEFLRGSGVARNPSKKTTTGFLRYLAQEGDLDFTQEELSDVADEIGLSPTQRESFFEEAASWFGGL